MNLKEKVFSGVRWTFSGTLLVTLIQLLQNIILARILMPEDFGVMAMILVFLGFIFPVFELGLSAAIIQEEKISNNQLSTLYWLNIALGILTYAITYVSAPIADYFFDTDRLHHYIRIVGLVFIISSFGVQFSALLSKNLNFSALNKISVSSYLIAAIVAVGLALAEHGVYALIFGYLSQRFIQTILNIILGRSYHIPSAKFRIGEVKDLIRFGVFQSGATLVNFLSANVDKILIGRILGTHALGLYTLIWNLVLTPMYKLNPIVTKVGFPVFSKIKNDIQAVNKYYSNALFFIMAINFPILLFIGLNPDLTILLLYGDQWLEATTVLSLLCVVGFLKSVANPGGSVLLSQGRSDLLFYWNLFWTLSITIILVTSLWIKDSLEMVAIGHLVAGILIGLIWHVIVSKYGFIHYYPIIKKALLLISFVIPGWILIWIINVINLENEMVALAYKLISGVLLYIIFFRILFNDKLQIIKELFKNARYSRL